MQSIICFLSVSGAGEDAARMKPSSVTAMLGGRDYVLVLVTCSSEWRITWD